MTSLQDAYVSLQLNDSKFNNHQGNQSTKSFSILIIQNVDSRCNEIRKQTQNRFDKHINEDNDDQRRVITIDNNKENRIKGNPLDSQHHIWKTGRKLELW